MSAARPCFPTPPPDRIAPPAYHRSRAFSLLELMIAIVILGIGLIMVATMFPIAWQRARTLSEFTSQSAIFNAADTTCRLLLQVDSSQEDHGSFAGDLVIWNVNPPPPSTPFPIVSNLPPNPPFEDSDTRVHALYLENIRVTPRGFYPDRNDATTSMSPPFRLEQVQADQPPGTLPSDNFFYTRAFGAPQIRFEQRVYPAMKPRIGIDPATGLFAGNDPAWETALDAHRFAFAVFHKLDKRTKMTELDATRDFQMYYVALKRPRPTLRYAQQDPAKAPDPMDRKTPVMPNALPEAEDLMFPTAWRVQLFFDPAVIGLRANSTGIPTEVQVNNTNFPTAPFVLDFFQEDAWFVDEVNGKVYRVTQRRIVNGPAGGQAFLTLDREVVIEDIDDGVQPSAKNGAVDADEQLRTVWVFPPPVEAGRGVGNPAVFLGKPPVMAVETRKLSVSPRP